MSKAHDLVKAIVDEDFVTAKELTKNLAYAAVSDCLDDVKREVAADIFAECTDCDDDSSMLEQAEKDYDQDHKLESPKDEVLGSRINAAVRAGRLTPAQAARTKNKGKYAV